MPEAPFDLVLPVDAYRLGLALEEIRAVADSTTFACKEVDHESYQRGIRAGLRMALRLIDLRIGVGS